jgi:hypothetical protein
VRDLSHVALGRIRELRKLDEEFIEENGASQA